jgi:Rice tungro bacilliform virus P46 protein.
METKAKTYTISDIFKKSVSRVYHFEGVISNIIKTPLITTGNKAEIEKMQNSIEAHRMELVKFFVKVFNSESMASHMYHKLYEDCCDMEGFYLNFDENNRNYFLFNEY